MSDAAIPPRDALDDCPLPEANQRANIRRYAAFWALYYFCAPISYIGLPHANLLKGLGNDDTICSLPGAVYQWLTVVPVLAAWRFGQARHLRPLVGCSLTAMILATGLVGVTLASGADARLATWATIAHGAAFGAANGVLITSLWDMLKRGISTSRRGVALGWAFGVGPLFACGGALLQDSLFEGQLLGGRSFGAEFPFNYAWMFLAITPLLLAAGVVLMRFEIPQVAEPTMAETFSPQELLEGVKRFAANRPVACAAVLYFAVYSGGNAIFPIVSLKADSALAEANADRAKGDESQPTEPHAGEQSEKESQTLGIQSFLRFGCKAIAGALLGWLLARASPRAPLVATTSILLAGLAWALAIKDWPFLAASGLLGAGELFGAYFPNYVATASDTKSARMNMALLSVLGAGVGFSALAFGAIADEYGRDASIYVAAGVLVCCLPLIRTQLPAHPGVSGRTADGPPGE